MAQASGSEIEELLFKNERASFVALMQKFNNLAVEMIENLKIVWNRNNSYVKNFSF